MQSGGSADGEDSTTTGQKEGVMNEFYSQQNTGSTMLDDADEMIRANGQADAQEVSELKAAARQYQSEILQLKALQQSNARLLETQRQQNDQLQKSNAQTLARIQTLLEQIADRAGAAPDWSGLEKHVEDAGYDAARKAEEVVNTASGNLSASIQSLEEKVEDLIQQSDDFQHKENVRVYRNVQAATDQLLQKQTDELRAEISPLRQQGSRSGGKGIGIAALVISVLTLVFVVCDSLGIVSMLLQFIRG